VHKEDPPLNEWRGTEFKLDEQAALDYFNKDIRDLFDWESHFYQYLDKECNPFTLMVRKGLGKSTDVDRNSRRVRLAEKVR
jgi:hypothetical protein